MNSVDIVKCPVCGQAVTVTDKGRLPEHDYSGARCHASGIHRPAKKPGADNQLGKKRMDRTEHQVTRARIKKQNARR